VTPRARQVGPTTAQPCLALKGTRLRPQRRAVRHPRGGRPSRNSVSTFGVSPHRPAGLLRCRSPKCFPRRCG
jgi:hypothetical protein